MDSFASKGDIWVLKTKMINYDYRIYINMFVLS
jgi:hypothetical protein